MEWSGYIQQAYEDLSEMQETHPNRYKNICKRINQESIAIRYAQIQLHNGSSAMKSEFKEDAIALGFTRKSQLVGIDQLWSFWGV